MQSLRENPFRLLGLLSSSSSREIDSRSKKLRQYLEAGVEPNITPDYYCPGFECEPMSRLPEVIKQAQERLALDQDKLLYALLWFVQMNETADSVALGTLEQGNLAEAKSIWSQQVYTEDLELRAVTKLNSSAFHNLSVCLLCSAQSADIVSGVKLGLMALEQGSVLSFLQEKLGIPSMSLQDVELLYLNRLIRDMQKRRRGGLSQLLDLLVHQEYTAKKALMKSYALDAVRTLEETIERSVHQSKTVTGAGLAADEKLLSGEILKQIAVSLPKNDPKYERASNALAKGVKSCGEGNFEDRSEQDDFASQRLMELCHKVRELCHKARELTHRDFSFPSYLSTALVLYKPTDKQEKWMNGGTFSAVHKFVDECEPLLAQIKEKLGEKSVVYQRYSTIVAQMTMGMFAGILDNTQNRDHHYLKDASVNAWRLIVRLDALGLEPYLRYTSFKDLRKMVVSLCSQLKVFSMIDKLPAVYIDWRDTIGEVRYLGIGFLFKPSFSILWSTIGWCMTAFLGLITFVGWCMMISGVCYVIYLLIMSALGC